MRCAFTCFGFGALKEEEKISHLAVRSVHRDVRTVDPALRGTVVSICPYCSGVGDPHTKADPT